MHHAIYVSNRENKLALIEQLKGGSLIALRGPAVAVYSKLELIKYLDLEHRHDIARLTSAREQSLATMSEGEQRKALLDYLLKQPCDVLLVDDVFDSLDVSSQQLLAQQLQALAQTTQIIQLFSRKRDRLEFIANSLAWRSGVLEPYQAVSMKYDFAKALPPPPNKLIELDNPLIELRQVKIEFQQRPILQALDWQINKGELWQLVGPNGSGKSSLLKLITGDSPKAYGQSVYLFGYQKGSGESVWDIKKHIGYFTSSVTQNFSRYQTVISMLLSGFFDSIGLYQQPSKQQQELAMQWLEFLGLESQAKKAFNELSVGHQRLLLVARAMVKYPSLLILDEPSAGLDDTDIMQLTALVNAMAKQQHMAIVFVSHRQEEGLRANKVLQLTPNVNGSIGTVITP